MNGYREERELAAVDLVLCVVAIGCEAILMIGLDDNARIMQYH
jgi:hypothetical protein